MRVIKARRAQAALVRGEQSAERGVHAQVATPRLGKARAAAVPVAPGPSSLQPWPLPAHRPPGSAPARDAHALRPPLKGPVHSSRVLRLPRPSLRSRLPLGWGWPSLRSHPSLPVARKGCRAAEKVYYVPTVRKLQGDSGLGRPAVGNFLVGVPLRALRV